MQIAKNMKQCKLHPRLGPKRFFALALYLALKFSTLHGKILNDAMIKRIVQTARYCSSRTLLEDYIETKALLPKILPSSPF